MNKKPDNSKPDTLFKTIIASVQMGLMLLGIIGIAAEVFRDQGIIKQLLIQMFSSGSSLAGGIFVLFLLYLCWRWINSAPLGSGSRRGDIPMYLMMGIGIFFLLRLFTTGSL
ncbi:MAG TPA: hypothetical protein VIK69_09335 [Methylophilaceae bacterium]|jgi:hypothetical protein